MPDNAELDRLYAEAKSALKSKEYDHATRLLTQILVIDENYRDVPRLLANVVRLKRRRWYSHPALWGTLGAVLLLGLGYFFIPKISNFYATQTPTQMITATTMPSPIPSATVTATLLPTPTPIPLIWKRIAMGLEFQRDTATAFATDKRDQDVIYVAMKNAGVYKTIDSGLSWRPAHQGMSNTQVESLFIDSQDPQILYAGTMGGVFKTKNGGESWFRVGDGTYLLMDYRDNSHLYARDENGIYETKDQGSTWTSTYALKKDCPDEIHSWAIHPMNGNMLFLGGGERCSGVYRSGDNGQNWELMGLKDKLNINTLVIREDNGQITIYAAFPTNIVADMGTFLSYDGGASWSQEAYLMCDLLAPDPNNSEITYCDQNVLRHRGDPWKSILGGLPLTNIGITAIRLDYQNGVEHVIVGESSPNQNNLFDTPSVAIFVSTGSGDWEERDNGVGAARAEIKIDPVDNSKIYLAAYYAAYYDRGCTLYRSLDKGKSWALIITPWYGPAWCDPTFDAKNDLYLMAAGSVEMSPNGGDTWRIGFMEGDYWEKQRTYILPSYYRDGIYFNGSQGISANPYFEGLVYDVGNVFYYSTNAGGLWQLGIGNDGLSDARLFYTDQSKMIYAIDRHRQKYSTDNGKTWQDCGTDVTASRSDTRLALDLQGSHLYLATPGQGVMVSTDKCQSWQPSNNGLTNLFVNTLAVDPNNPDTVYAGTDGGAYISYDAGATWGQVNDGLLGAVVVYSIAVDKESNVYAATPYGVFKLESK